MKKKFIDFSVKSQKFAPRMNSRRMRIGFGRHNIAYREDGAPAGTETEDEPKTEKEALAAMSKQLTSLTALLGESAKKEDITAQELRIKKLEEGLETMTSKEVMNSITSINKANEKILGQIAEMQEKAAQEAEQKSGAPTKKGLQIKAEDVKAFVKTLFAKEPDAKGRVDSENKVDGKSARIEITTAKAAETFGYATFFEGGDDTDITAFTGRFVDPELNQRTRKANLILDHFTIRTINVPTLVYLVKVEDGDDVDSLSGDSGGADWILPGEEKPRRSFKVTTGKVDAKKVAIYGNVDDELLQDVSSLQNWIREDFMDEMRETINDGLLNNDPDVNPKAPLGLKTRASQFTVTPAFNNKYTDPTTYIDQILAALASMRYRREKPAKVFVSSDVIYAIYGLKDDNNRYQNSNLIYVSSIGQLYIAGVPIYEADQEDVPSTHILLVSANLGFKIFAYGPMVFESGLNTDDFRRDRTSYRGYQRFLTYISEHRENSVMYDTFANIEAAIEA